MLKIARQITNICDVMLALLPSNKGQLDGFGHSHRAALPKVIVCVATLIDDRMQTLLWNSIPYLSVRRKGIEICGGGVRNRPDIPR